jgi:serine/threonine-protein kinase HipA
MNRCPITYQDCGENRYSPEGLKKLSPKLKDLSFPYSAAQSLQEARERSGKMSIESTF